MLSLLEQKFYYFFFLINIPISTIIDSTSVIPEKYHLAPGLLNWHIRTNNDFILYENDTILKVFTAIELLFQVPFYIFATRSLLKFWKLSSMNTDEAKAARFTLWHKLAVLMRLYGLNASSTTLYLLWQIWHRGYYPTTGLPMSPQDKLKLGLLYLPYFLLPVRLIFA
ncbi:Ema19p Ecym_1451 [Eremothecium cymbalariae DBVPG|uniref:Efficient mitochondria targeting-associated protein 19 n=1 Tax=Eremothecium cymbalariae (strain CBS 270.75 / DBVPG 7215 / KCTC 17166 / NRRL Y-17582) TaxID=931890 RepID=G8JMG0_ERECY|nr:hypothetical protein Ecym_1451 [Eremothecium cymbalariae DBVPG\